MLRNPVIVAVVLATFVAVSLGAGNDASGDNILKSIQKRIDKSMAKRADFTNNNIGTGTHVNTNNAGSSPSGQSFTNNNMGSGDHINTNTASGSSSGSTINNNLGTGNHVNTNVRRLASRPSDDVVIGPGDVASKPPLDPKIKAIRDAIATLHKDQQNRMKRADITNNNMGAGDHVNNNVGAGDHVNNNVASSSTDTKKPSGGDTIVNKNRDISERADFTNTNMGSGTHVNNNGASQSSNMHMPIDANNNNNSNNHDEDDEDEDEPSSQHSSSSGSTFVNKNRDANEKVSKTERADFTNNNIGSGTHVNNNGGSSGSSGQSFLNNNMGGSSGTHMINNNGGGSGNSIWTAPNGDTFINSNGRDANMTMNKTMDSSDLSERPKREKIVMLNKAREKRADFTNNNVGPGDHVNNNNGGGSNGQSFFNNNVGSGTAINNNDGSNGQSFFNNNVGSNGQSFVNNNVGGSMAVDSNGIPLTSTTIVNNNGQQLTMVNTYRPVQVKQGSQMFIIGYYRYLNNRLQGATIWRSVTDRLGLNAMSFFPQNEIGGVNLINQVI